MTGDVENAQPPPQPICIGEHVKCVNARISSFDRQEEVNPRAKKIWKCDGKPVVVPFFI